MFPDIKSISLLYMTIVPVIVFRTAYMTSSVTLCAIITWIHMLFPFLMLYKPYTASSSLDILPWLKPGDSGIITNIACLNSRSYKFSPQWTMPCPSLFYAKNILLPSRSIFIDAFLSLLCILPHLGQVHFLIVRFLVSVFRYPQSEHS